jgi:hypothetical protein
MVVVQNIAENATPSTYFSRYDSLRNQFYLSYHTATDSTDGMMNQFKTAATSPGTRVSQSYNLLPPNSKHYNMFNVVRASGSDSSWYADSVRASAPLSYTVIESTTTRTRYRIHERVVYDNFGQSRDAKVTSELTIYPTGHIFVYDSSISQNQTGGNAYGVQFTQRSGTGTVLTNDDTAYGGLYNTASGQNTLHDFTAGFLTYETGGTPSEPFTAATPISGLGGFYISAADDGSWKSTSSPWEQNFFIDFSTDDADDSDSLKKLLEDKYIPAIIDDWRTGSTKTDAAGDLNSDGFNEREGCYEIVAASGIVYFWFNEDNSRTRYYPVFKMNNYTSSTPPTRVLLISPDERLIDTCFADRGDVNIMLDDANNFVVFQLNRIFDGPVIIFCCIDDGDVSVELSRFWGVADSGVCELFWVTESEHENKGFNLLRRLYPRYARKAPKKMQGDTTFQVVAHYERNKALKGKLTKASRTDYAYTDSDVELGLTYEYALEAVDILENKERYPGTVILTVDKTFMFNLAQNYPNPFNPVTTIKYTVPGRYSRGKKQFVMLERASQAQAVPGALGRQGQQRQVYCLRHVHLPHPGRRQVDEVEEDGYREINANCKT